MYKSKATTYILNLRVDYFRIPNIFNHIYSLKT